MSKFLELLTDPRSIIEIIFYFESTGTITNNLFQSFINNK